MLGLWTFPQTRKCGKWNRNICGVPICKLPENRQRQEKICTPAHTYLFLSLSGLTHVSQIKNISNL
jgi:hypothetical protein